MKEIFGKFLVSDKQFCDYYLSDSQTNKIGKEKNHHIPPKTNSFIAQNRKYYSLCDYKYSVIKKK